MAIAYPGPHRGVEIGLALIFDDPGLFEAGETAAGALGLHLHGEDKQEDQEAGVQHKGETHGQA